MRVETEERLEIAGELRQGVRRSGLTQAAFARAIGTSPSRFSTYVSGSTVPSAAIYLRALRLGSSLAAARARGLMTPDDTTASVNRALTDGDEDWAFRMVLQARDDLRAALRSELRDELVGAWTRRAAAIDAPRYDALFRALIAHEFGSDAPAWTAGPTLAEEWVMDDPFRDEATIRAETPSWLAAAGIYIAERGLATA